MVLLLLSVPCSLFPNPYSLFLTGLLLLSSTNGFFCRGARCRRRSQSHFNLELFHQLAGLQFLRFFFDLDFLLVKPHIKGYVLTPIDVPIERYLSIDPAQLDQ